MIAPRRSSHSSDRVDEPHTGLVAVAEHARTAARTGRRPQGPAASQRTSGTALRCRLVSFRTPPADQKACEASCTSPGGPPGAPEPARAQGGRRRRPPASGPSAFNELTELWKVTELGFPLVVDSTTVAPAPVVTSPLAYGAPVVTSPYDDDDSFEQFIDDGDGDDIVDPVVLAAAAAANRAISPRTSSEWLAQATAAAAIAAAAAPVAIPPDDDSSDYITDFCPPSRGM